EILKLHLKTRLNSGGTLETDYVPQVEELLLLGVTMEVGAQLWNK
ncbi:unnamed protein product, partial [marine sediment metagenome]